MQPSDLLHGWYKSINSVNPDLVIKKEHISQNEYTTYKIDSWKTYYVQKLKEDINNAHTRYKENL